MAELRACQHCAGRVQDDRQRTCPHCLEELRVRSFRSREDLDRFREDRRAHGAPVPEEDEGGSRTLAAVLSVAATIMIVAGGAIAYAGIASGQVPYATRSIGQAIVPLAMGLGLFEMARRHRGGRG